MSAAYPSSLLTINPSTCESALIITTNLPFARWGDIFDGTTVATAIADRLVYNSEILIMEGESYRKK
jgi:DNA replication protein DnaC